MHIGIAMRSWNTNTRMSTTHTISIRMIQAGMDKKPHSHSHLHEPIEHAHPHYPDIHHRHDH